MSLAPRSRDEVAIGCAIVIVCPIVAGLAVNRGSVAMLVAVAVLALCAGLYVGLRHPLWLYWMLAVALGALPLGYFPGIHLPLTLGLGAGVLLAALIHPTEVSRLSKLEVAVIFLVLVSAVSVVATARSIVDIGEFAKWTMSTLMVIALLRLSRSSLTRFGQIFVCASAAATLLAIGIMAADPGGRLIKTLKIFGYGRDEETQRYFYGADVVSLRLTGTYVDPNAAGIFITIALVGSLILFRGWMRATFAILFVAGLALTLSRAAIFTVLVGILLVFCLHAMRARDRRIFIGVMAVSIMAALITPQVRSRIFQSFGDSDVGSSAREDALKAFPGQMAGHWIFGLGWGRPEFKSGATGFTLNHVANAPLLTIYRGGIITGLAFILVLLIGCVMSYRALRSASMPAAMSGGIFIGFCGVALQLDFPVVTIPSVTMVFSIFLVFLVYTERFELEAPNASATSTPGLATPEVLSRSARGSE